MVGWLLPSQAGSIRYLSTFVLVCVSLQPLVSNPLWVPPLNTRARKTLLFREPPLHSMAVNLRARTPSLLQGPPSLTAGDRQSSAEHLQCAGTHLGAGDRALRGKHCPNSGLGSPSVSPTGSHKRQDTHRTGLLERVPGTVRLPSIQRQLTGPPGQAPAPVHPALARTTVCPSLPPAPTAARPGSTPLHSNR